MKRKTVKTVICATLMAIAMSVTACGSSNNGAASTESSGQKTLEEFLAEDPTTEQQLQEQAAAQENDQMDMEIEVKGNEVMCIATFKDSVELSDDMAAQLQEGIESVGSSFSALAGMLDDSIGAEKGTVSYGVRYCAPDGTVLAEASFSAE